MSDENRTSGLHKAWSPSDSVTLPLVNGSAPRGFYVGGNGNVVIRGVDDVDTTFTAVVAGAIYPLTGKLIKATGTTATGLVLLY